MSYADFLKNLTIRQWVGGALLVVSTLAWLALPVVPFLALEATAKVALATGLVIVGEVTFYPGVALLGKEAVAFFRDLWQRIKRPFGRRADPVRSDAELGDQGDRVSGYSAAKGSQSASE